jgi:hypothetical protein
MHPDELLYLMSPQDLMKIGRYNMALEKLKVLLRANPHDKELKRMVRKCRAAVEGNILTRLLRAF